MYRTPAQKNDGDRAELVYPVDDEPGPLLRLLAWLLPWAQRWRRRRVVVFRIEDGVLEVRMSASAVPVRLPLAELVDVGLDTKTVATFQDGGSLVAAARVAELRVGPDVDKARVFLRFEEGGSVSLGDDYVAHMHAMAWLGKIRLFLRHHGWVPEDERDAARE